MTIKALSLWQPWATFIALGIKGYETRSWSTGHRGPLAIHASAAKMNAEVVEWVKDLADRTLYEYGISIPTKPEDYPLGMVLCTTRLVACHRVTRGLISEIGEIEFEVGDWTPGRYVWELSDIERLEPPVPARGALGLWEWTP
jgi:activating signal cointegrator 1